MEWIAARGHGQFTSMTALEALAAAAATTPEPPFPSEILQDDPALGETVSVTPVDYGRANPSTGILVAIDAKRVAIQHTNERTGFVTTHFPRFGYTVKLMTT